MADNNDGNLNNNTNNNNNTPQLPGGNSNGNNNPLAKQDYDIMDPEAKAKSNANKSIGDKATDVKDMVDKGKNIASKFSKATPGAAGAGAGGTVAGAGTSVLGLVGFILLIIIIVIGVIGYLTSIPGLMIAKIKEIAQNAINGVQSLFTTEANAYIDNEDIADLANYLEEMEYDLVGYGFVNVDLDYMKSLENVYKTKDYTELREEGYIYYETRTENGDKSPRYYNEDGQAYGEGEGESGYYYNSLGILIDNSTGEIAELLDTNNFALTERDLDDDEDTTTTSVYVDQYGIWRSTTEMSSSGEGLIYSLEGLTSITGSVDDTLLRSYLLSDYRINTLRNDDDEITNNIWANIKSVFGGYDAAWSKGLIKLYVAENGLAKNVYNDSLFDSIFGTSWFDTIEIDADSATMTIKSGFFNNTMEYDIDGWADRYGMNLEFLLSLHLATMAPDLVYAMLQSFDTEVQVYLNDSGDASVESLYVEISDSSATVEDDGITLSDIKTALKNGGFGTTINKKSAQYLLTCEELNLESPPGCIGGAVNYVILDSSYSNSYDLQSYNITESVDSEVYAEFDEYTSDEETISVVENEKEFTLENVSQSIGKYDDEYLNDEYTLLTDSAESYGYDEDTAEIEDIDNPDETFETAVANTSGLNLVTDDMKMTVYKIYRYKQYRTWTAEIDGDEVEFEWVTYKYLVYEAGTQVTHGYGSGTENETTDDPEYNDEEIWVDTIMVEYIVREKTISELEEAGILVWDDDIGDYVAVSTSESRCSDEENRIRCCPICFDYVQKVKKALNNLSDSSYQTSTPYIARVLGSWFRDTYFVIPENIDVAIKDYENESSRSSAEEDMISNSYGNSGSYVKVDEDYLADTGEYWTEYELDDDGDYLLYYMYPNGITSDYTLEEFLDDPYTVLESYQTGYSERFGIQSDGKYASQEEAEDDGHVFVKKAATNSASDLSASKITTLVWSAYGFNSDGSSTGWIHIAQNDTSVSDNTYVEAVYSMFEENWENDDGGFYYKLEQTNSVTQIEDAQRSETNSTVKWLFKYRKYYIYDGTEATALEIAEDKEIVLDWVEDYLETKYGGNWANHVASEFLGEYGRSALRQTYATITFGNNDEDDQEEVAEQWLEWQLDMYYSGITNDCPEKYIILTDDIGFIEKTDSDGNVTGLTLTTDLSKADRVGDPRDPDLINTVNIDKTSLEAFTILENTGTLAAEYAYRDFKELIVELDYFDKEDLSDAIASVFTWIIPDVSEIGWPVRPYDKQDVDYGALIESAGTYEFLDEINYEVDEDEESEDGDSTEDDNTEDDSTDDDTDTDSGNDSTSDSETNDTDTDESEDSSESTTFVGYEGDELVSSPITGKVIEYGTHTRTNVYTEEEEEVGYIIIQALETETDFGTSSTSYITDYLYSGNEENALSDEKAMTEALNLFYDEYEDTCDGYTVMIDGLKIEDGVSETITDSNEIWEILKELQDDEGNYGYYEQNEVAELYKEGEQSAREAAEQAKDDAPYLVMVNGEVYVKEGKYIGTTRSDDDLGEESIYTETDDEGNAVVDEEGNPIEGPANYIRIILKDTDYTVIDNVEDYFDIPEPESSSSSGIYAALEAITDDSTLEEKIRAIMSYFISQEFTEKGAAGIVGNLLGESNNLDPTAYNSSRLLWHCPVEHGLRWPMG